ncbi:zinc dependent phospholipase C family protein [Desulfothermus okinawensis JCM 13304]
MSKNKFFLIFLLLAILFPINAFAWGPGFHLSLGLYVFDNLNLLLPNVADTIIKFPYHFLYGCISPDVLIGKGKKISKAPSHNWNTGFKLLQSESIHVKSYAFGYLTHLASDVIAHNYFIPNMLQLFKLNRGKVFHVLIEGIIDRSLNTNPDILNDLMKSNFKEIDLLLIKTIKNKKSTFKIKKMIFKKGVSLNFTKPLNRSNKLNGGLIEKKLYGSWDYVQDMFKLSKKSAIEILNKQNISDLKNYDPMGFKNLGLAKKSNKIFFKNRYKGVVPFFVPSMYILNL